MGLRVTGNDFVIIKALEDGVNVIGLTRGSDTKFGHLEKLDEGSNDCPIYWTYIGHKNQR